MDTGIVKDKESNMRFAIALGFALVATLAFAQPKAAPRFNLEADPEAFTACRSR